MAHYAFLDENNIVTEVIVGIDETETIDGLETEVWYSNFRGQACKRTSYNTLKGEHRYNGIPFRKNYAGIGYTYDGERDAFIPPKPYTSWLLNETTCQWEAPISYPNVDHIPEYYKYYNQYEWNEETLTWELFKYTDTWTLNQDGYYEAPIPYPTDGKVYEWSVSSNDWIEKDVNL